MVGRGLVRWRLSVKTGSGLGSRGAECVRGRDLKGFEVRTRLLLRWTRTGSGSGVCKASNTVIDENFDATVRSRRRRTSNYGRQRMLEVEDGRTQVREALAADCRIELNGFGCGLSDEVTGYGWRLISSIEEWSGIC